MRRLVIVNADDFGYSSRVNAAVLRAHRDGILTSASLMVAEPGFNEAVAMARSTPTLGVGLHVATTYDRALLPPAKIPHIAGASGKFGRDPFLTGLHYAASRSAREELRREMAAQFARFAATGLDWSHADGHQHFHLHPAVWSIFLDLCQEHGVRRIRLPRESLERHRLAGGDTPPLNTVATLFLQLLCRRCLRQLRGRRAADGRPFFVCGRVYGTYQTGDMSAGYTLRLLDRLEAPVSEIYYHPGAPHARPLPEAHGCVRDVELAALLDPAVNARARRPDIALVTYQEADRLSR